MAAHDLSLYVRRIQLQISRHGLHLQEQKLSLQANRAMLRLHFQFLIMRFILLSLLLIASPALAQVSSGPATCVFNDNRERCQAISRGNRTTARWLSDGKVVHYDVDRCSIAPFSGGKAQNCRVRVTEDNGRISSGSAVLGGGCLQVYSLAGNSTVICSGWTTLP